MHMCLHKDLENWSVSSMWGSKGIEQDRHALGFKEWQLQSQADAQRVFTELMVPDGTIPSN